MVTKLIIGVIPIITYVIIWFWINALINDRIKNKENRIRYKKYFGKNLIDVLTPFFFISTIIIWALLTKDQNEKERNFNIIFIFLNIIFLLIPQIGIAKIKLKRVKLDLAKLKTQTEIEIIDTI